MLEIGPESFDEYQIPVETPLRVLSFLSSRGNVAVAGEIQSKAGVGPSVVDTAGHGHGGPPMPDMGGLQRLLYQPYIKFDLHHSRLGHGLRKQYGPANRHRHVL